MPCCFKYYYLDTTRILKYSVNIKFLSSLSEHIGHPGLTVNSDAPFCLDSMKCLNFFGPGVSSSLLKPNFKTNFSFCI